MLINHRTVQLGVVNQKRPEIWQSYIPPLTHTVDTVSLAIDTSDYKLRTVAHDHTLQTDLATIGASIGDHKLYDPTKTLITTDDVAIDLTLGNHKLTTTVKDLGQGDDLATISADIGDHKLYNWGIYAEVTDEDHAELFITIGDHKLIEEKS